MNSETVSSFIHFLPESLWTLNGRNVRSKELTPLFIDRYNGLRQRAIPTAHSFWELTFVFKGRGYLNAATSHLLKPHKACLVPPKMPHAETSNGTLDTLWIGLRGTDLNYLERKCVSAVFNRQLDVLFERLWFRAERPYGPIGPELDGLTRAVLGTFFRLLTEDKGKGHDYIDLSVQYINQHFSEDISVSMLAARFGYSEGYFYRTFRRRTGKTPLNYLTGVRIQHALRYIQHTSMKIEKIARMVGYKDPLYFSRVFRNVTRKSPSEVRSEHL